MKKTILFSIICLSFASCSQLMQVASQLGTTASSTLPVTNAENISGLKSSLNIGIEQAVSSLGVQDGFYKNAALKLLLPKEAQSIVDNIKMIPGGQALVDKAVLSLNRSAEDAVKEATPIFKNAILNMSLTDGVGILFGGNNAATEFLRKKHLLLTSSRICSKSKSITQQTFSCQCINLRNVEYTQFRV